MRNRSVFSGRVYLALAAFAFVMLTGCAPLLERQYVTAEPHSSKLWESEAAGTLRAENHQDIVNDLLLLIDRHAENATIRLYHFDDELTVSDTLEKAAMEIQQETPLGSYAVSYIVSSSQAQRGYYEVKLQIGYRKSAEQLRAIVNATSPEAVYSLLREALEEGRTELAVRIGYWGPNGTEQVNDAIARLLEEMTSSDTESGTESVTESDTRLSVPETDAGTESGDMDQPVSQEADNADKSVLSESDNTEDTTDTPLWPVVHYYPENGPVGLVEFLLAPFSGIDQDADLMSGQNFD